MLSFKGFILKVGTPQEIEVDEGLQWVCNGAALTDLSKAAKLYLQSEGVKYLLCTLSGACPQFTLAVSVPDVQMIQDGNLSLSVESDNPKAEIHVTGCLSMPPMADYDLSDGEDGEDQSISDSGSESGSNDGVISQKLAQMAQKVAAAKPPDKKPEAAKGATKAAAARPAAAPKASADAKPQTAKKPEAAKAASKAPGSNDESEGSADGESGSISGSSDASEVSEGSGGLDLGEIDESSSADEKPAKAPAPKKTGGAPGNKPITPTGGQKSKPATQSKPATPGQKPGANAAQSKPNTPGQKPSQPKAAVTPGQKPKTPGTPGVITCFACGQVGHKSPDCPTKKAGGAKPLTPGGAKPQTPGGEKRKPEQQGGDAKKQKKDKKEKK